MTMFILKVSVQLFVSQGYYSFGIIETKVVTP